MGHEWIFSGFMSIAGQFSYIFIIMSLLSLKLENYMSKEKYLLNILCYKLFVQRFVKTISTLDYPLNKFSIFCLLSRVLLWYWASLSKHSFGLFFSCHQFVWVQEGNTGQTDFRSFLRARSTWRHQHCAFHIPGMQ